MTMKNDAKFEEELTCRFKIDLTNWQFWPEHLKVSKMFTLMCSFWAKYILVELKKYIGVIFHDTEEWYKICRGINVSFQNWHEEFGRFWPEHLKVSKIFTLMGSFWTKYILFELKRYRGFIFHDTEEWSKIWRKTDCGLENDMGNLANFHQIIWKCQNLDVDGILLSKVENVWA